MRECVHLPPIDGALDQLRSSQFQNALHQWRVGRQENAHFRCHCGSDDVWICLSKDCLAPGCGRAQRQHALHHFEDTGHAVCIQPSTTRIWCYACDDEILDEQSAKLVDLRRAVKPMESASSTISERRGVTGLSNLGNTCFMNSALQCLAHTPSLQRNFRKVTRAKQHTPQRKLVAGFTNWFTRDWKSAASSHSPDDILRTVQQLNPMFQGYAQHDAQEFLRFVLDSMHDTLKTQVPVDAQKYLRRLDSCMDACGNSSSSLDDGTRPARHAEKNDDAVDLWSIIRRTFGARIVSSVTCLCCRQESRTIDPAYDISVPIPESRLRPDIQEPPTSANSESGTAYQKASNFMKQKLNTVGNWFVDRGVHLTDCLHKFCEAEVLTGRDQYLCEKCKRKNDCEKTILLLELPEVLCIHVKRFRYDGSAWFGTKNSKPVDFPLKDFDVREFLDRESKEKEAVYRLIGVVQHMGSMGSGHYIAYCRHYKSKEWFEFDDSRVTLVGPEVVKKAEPYILFYQKVPSKVLKARRGTVKADKRRLQDMLTNGLLSENTPEVCYISTEWYQRLQTSSVCGPIDNYIHLCPHGRLGVLDQRQSQKFIAISTSTFQQLVQHYGGGPVVRSTEPCEMCARHLRAYNARRREEHDLVQKYDTKDTGSGKYWYLVDAVWVEKWKKYIDDGSGINSVQEMIEPGKINSARLCEDLSEKPKRNLKFRTDYIGINATVWAIFAHIHGLASPPIVREGLDIYSPRCFPPQAPLPTEIDGHYKIGWQYVDVCKGNSEMYHKQFGRQQHSDVKQVVSDEDLDLDSAAVTLPVPATEAATLNELPEHADE